MKLSVVVNPKGEIVAASIPIRDPASAGNLHAMDQLRLPEGHKAHELNMPSDLANAFLDGRFSEAFEHYKLVHEGGEAILKKR
jgi:hypothetical protein